MTESQSQLSDSKSIFKSFLDENDYKKLQFVLLSTAGWIDNLQRKFFERFNVSQSQYQCIWQLAKVYPNMLSARQIREGLTDYNPDLNRLLEKLVAKGLIEKVSARHNRRLYELRITEAGLALHDKIDRFISELDLNLYILSKEECREAIHLLEKLRSGN
jgi:DNA-binding MarR family transcriptional regulator